MAANDYLIDDDLDLVISGGDFVKAAGDQQASILLLNSNKGSYKFHPFAGMGIKRYLGTAGTEQIIKREITVQHQADGLRIETLVLKSTAFSAQDFYLSFTRPGFD